MPPLEDVATADGVIATIIIVIVIVVATVVGVIITAIIGVVVTTIVGVIVTIAAITLVGVADDDNGVVDAGTTVVRSGDDTALVVLEGSTASVNSDSKRVSLELFLDTLNASALSDLAPVGNFTNDLVGIVSALGLGASVARRVRVV